MTESTLILLPLQSIDNFALNDIEVSVTETIIGISILLAIILSLFIINYINKKASPSAGVKKPKSENKSSLFSGFAMHRISRSLGLSREQSRMLEYVFKTDYVTDPEKSINTPALLDRHFRKSYRIIEQSPGSDKEAQNRFALLFSTRNILENSIIGGITSTQQLKDDITLTLTYGKDKLHVGIVSTNSDYIVVEAPKTILGSLIKIPRGTRLTAMFFNKNNKGFSFETRVIGYSGRDGNSALQLAHSHQLRFLSQRRYRRRQASIACSLYLVYVEGSGKKQRLMVDKRRLQGNIADISVGGCSIKTIAPVQVGARFKIEFSQSEENLAALGQVLRSNRIGASTVIHVRFLRVSQKSMNIINAFVYEYGRE
ncbi:MAG: PilZ domain-containing protein [Treponema sp.]|nr:PilZ domain-containing protein [Treponema sp.]